MLSFTGPCTGRDSLPSEGIGFVEKEEQTQKHDCTANFREAHPEIRLSFSAGVVVLCKRIVVLGTTKVTSTSEKKSTARVSRLRTSRKLKCCEGGTLRGGRRKF